MSDVKIWYLSTLCYTGKGLTLGEDVKGEVFFR